MTDHLYDDLELRDAMHAAVAGGPPAPSTGVLLRTAHRVRRGRHARRAVGGLATRERLREVLVSTGSAPWAT